MHNASKNPLEPSWRRDPDRASDGTIEENWLFRLGRERYVSRTSGKAHAYYVMHLADSVNVIALTPSKEVVLVRQFRAGSGRDSLEPPGGLIEPGEDPCGAGVRELLQETGYKGDPAVLIGSVWSNPSIMTARNYTILVENAVQVAEPLLDVEEEVVVELVPAEAIPRIIKDGSIDHALSVLGLVWWLCRSTLG
jgi:8-oxo-dGTP pyrophosphatase MutT (NUDIX family)